MVQQARINRRERGHTRERILAAARELFAQRGYAATSVRMIADRAGVTDPAIYYYFPTKRELHDSLLVEPDVCDLARPAGSLELGVDRIMAFFFRYADNPDLVRVALREQVSGEPLAILFRRTVERRFREFAGPFFDEHFGDAARDVESIVTYTLSGAFWDAILSLGSQFEEAVAEDHFRRRMRDTVLACMPDPVQRG